MTKLINSWNFAHFFGMFIGFWLGYIVFTMRKESRAKRLFNSALEMYEKARDYLEKAEALPQEIKIEPERRPISEAEMQVVRDNIYRALGYRLEKAMLNLKPLHWGDTLEIVWPAEQFKMDTALLFPEKP